MDAIENGNTVEETDEAILSLGLPMAPSVLLQMVGPRVANHVLETLHEAYPDRYPLSPTLANYADGKDDIVLRGDARRTVDEIREDALEAVADEVRHLLDEGVVETLVADAAAARAQLEAVAAQALDFRLELLPGTVPGTGVRAAHATIRAVVPRLHGDREPGPDLAAALRLVRSGQLAELVTSRDGGA